MLYIIMFFSYDQYIYIYGSLYESWLRFMWFTWYIPFFLVRNKKSHHPKRLNRSTMPWSWWPGCLVEVHNGDGSIVLRIPTCWSWDATRTWPKCSEMMKNAPKWWTCWFCWFKAHEQNEIEEGNTKRLRVGRCSDNSDRATVHWIPFYSIGKGGSIKQWFKHQHWNIWCIRHRTGWG